MVKFFRFLPKVEVAVRRVFDKKTVWNSFKKFIGKHICRSLLLNKVAGLLPTIFWKYSPVQTFSCEFRQMLYGNFSQSTSGRLILLCDCFYPFVRWIDLCPKMLPSTSFFLWFPLSIFRANNVDHLHVAFLSS